MAAATSSAVRRGRGEADPESGEELEGASEAVGARMASRTGPAVAAAARLAWELVRRGRGAPRAREPEASLSALGTRGEGAAAEKDGARAGTVGLGAGPLRAALAGRGRDAALRWVSLCPASASGASPAPLRMRAVARAAWVPEPCMQIHGRAWAAGPRLSEALGCWDGWGGGCGGCSGWGGWAEAASMGTGPASAGAVTGCPADVCGDKQKSGG